MLRVSRLLRPIERPFSAFPPPRKDAPSNPPLLITAACMGHACEGQKGGRGPMLSARICMEGARQCSCWPGTPQSPVLLNYECSSVPPMWSWTRRGIRWGHLLTSQSAANHSTSKGRMSRAQCLCTDLGASCHASTAPHLSSPWPSRFFQARAVRMTQPDHGTDGAQQHDTAR
jgi:hypothetical protein